MSFGSQYLSERAGILFIASTRSGLLRLARYTQDDYGHSTEAFQLLKPGQQRRNLKSHAGRYRGAVTQQVGFVAANVGDLHFLS